MELRREPEPCPGARQQRALGRADLAAQNVDVARSVGIPADSRDTLKAALTATAHLGLVPAPRILITGSLYLAGEVLAQNGTPPE